MTKSISTDAVRGRLLRVLGVGFGLAVIIGNTIGSGIFRTPGQIAAHLPNVWLYLSVWVIGGIYALLGAVQIAELGTMIPRSGGQYVFARHALGEYAGFIVGWSDWISTCGSTAAVRARGGATRKQKRTTACDTERHSHQYLCTAAARRELSRISVSKTRQACFQRLTSSEI